MIFSAYFGVCVSVSLVCVLCNLRAVDGVDVDNPITPATFMAEVMGKGFSTNYFKVENERFNFQTKHVEDLKARGFGNLRLRCNASLFDVNNKTIFKTFLGNLAKVVDDCLNNSVTPLISWLDADAEACARESDRLNYLKWWQGVAKHLKDRNYRLAFNLFTENGEDKCHETGRYNDSLRANIDKYTKWTKNVIGRIRNTGGNNNKRIIVITAPGKKANSLEDIEPSIYEKNDYLGAEWHLYAAGPTKDEGQREWVGQGTEEDKQRVIDSIIPAVNWTSKTGVPTVQAAWMTYDNHKQQLDLNEVIAFGRYYALKLRENGIPWCMNVFNDFYDTKNSEWITGNRTYTARIGDKTQILNPEQILDEIKEVY